MHGEQPLCFDVRAGCGTRVGLPAVREASFLQGLPSALKAKKDTFCESNKCLFRGPDTWR